MKRYTFGLFTKGDGEPVGCITLGLNDTITADSILRDILQIPAGEKHFTELMQLTEADDLDFIRQHTAICELCVPYFMATSGFNWPREDWYSLTPQLDLQLISDLDSANNDVNSAYVYNVDSDKTDVSAGVLIYSSAYTHISDFIKKYSMVTS